MINDPLNFQEIGNKVAKVRELTDKEQLDVMEMINEDLRTKFDKLFKENAELKEELKSISDTCIECGCNEMACGSRQGSGCTSTQRRD